MKEIYRHVIHILVLTWLEELAVLRLWVLELSLARLGGRKEVVLGPLLLRLVLASGRASLHQLRVLVVVDLRDPGDCGRLRRLRRRRGRHPGRAGRLLASDDVLGSGLGTGFTFGHQARYQRFDNVTRRSGYSW